MDIDKIAKEVFNEHFQKETQETFSKKFIEYLKPITDENGKVTTTETMTSLTAAAYMESVKTSLELTTKILQKIYEENQK